MIVIPAFESEHIQNFIHVCNFRLDGLLLLFQQFPAQRVCRRTLHAPVHKLLDVLDLKPRHFETFDHPQGFKLVLAEFSYAGPALYSGEKTLLTKKW